jgi:hypothetical protein
MMTDRQKDKESERQTEREIQANLKLLERQKRVRDRQGDRSREKKNY